MNLPTTTIKVASTLGRNKIASLDADSRPSLMKIIMRGDENCQCADLEVYDVKGRRFGVQIGNQSLIELQQFLNQYI